MGNVKNLLECKYCNFSLNSTDVTEETAMFWQELIELYQVPERGGVWVTVENTPVLVSRDGEQVNGFAMQCPHLGYSLEFGKIWDGEITCPFHNYRFSLQDGRCLNAICQDLIRYPIKIVDQQVLINLTPQGETQA